MSCGLFVGCGDGLGGRGRRGPTHGSGIGRSDLYVVDRGGLLLGSFGVYRLPLLYVNLSGGMGYMGWNVLPRVQDGHDLPSAGNSKL